MSADIAISVENVSKCYQIYDRPRDRLRQIFAGKDKKYYREFWALKDVSFEVKRGETVGIIGRNGSGKSTLLQMICGTLTPTSGRIQTFGRVAALLELGAGFNPEFTGRENVFMNGEILGLTRAEIENRFDQIAAFADIGEHLEQPVKTYSSGMYVRLAFAVIAHVDADILVVDEALAVGDAVFTQKCMRFIRRFRENGTLLFVSHDTGSVLNLCEQGVWLHKGNVQQVGTAKEVVEAYFQYTQQEIYGNEAKLTTLKQNVDNPLEPNKQDVVRTTEDAIDYGAQMQLSDNLTDANGWKSGAGEILSATLIPLLGKDSGVFVGGELVRLKVSAIAHQAMDHPILGFLVRDRLGQDIFGENTLPFTASSPCPIPAGCKIEASFDFRLPMLPNGKYVMMLSLADGDLHNNIQHHWMHDALLIDVYSSKVRWGLAGIEFDKVSLTRL